MKRLVVRLALALSLLAIGAGFFACSRTGENAARPLEKVTIACATPPYTALVDIALANDFFRRKGLDVTPLFHSTGRGALDDVLEGKADFATVAETPVMFAILNGKMISLIATIQSSNQTNAVLARADRGINAPQDLKGKRIAVPMGTIGEYFLDAFLATQGIARTDVEMTNLNPEQMPEALARGEVDVASTFAPFLNQAQQRLGGKSLTFYDKDIYTQTFNLVSTHEQTLGNPPRIRKMLHALIEAEGFALRNPEKARDIIAGFRRTDKTVLSGLWNGNTFSVSLDQSLVLALEDESQWAMRKGLTGAREVPNYLNYIYFDALMAVKPEAVRILR